MCRESKGLINVPDKLGRTPLLAGLMAGANVEAVKELLEQGEDPGQEDEVGRGAPEAAVLYCDCQVPTLPSLANSINYNFRLFSMS